MKLNLFTAVTPIAGDSKQAIARFANIDSGSLERGSVSAGYGDIYERAS
jgi:hypothetical protein